MGIRFYCPDCGRRLNIKAFLAGKRGICPHCDSRVLIPMHSQLPDDAPKHRPTSAAVPESSGAAVATVTASAQSADPVVRQPTTVPTTEERPADPIADSPDSVWYVRPTAGGQYGPARGDVMQSWLSEGRVSADSMVWREGWEDWKLAGPIFPSLEAAPSSAKAAAVSSAPSFLVPGDEEQDISKPVVAPAPQTRAPRARERRVVVKKKSIAPLIVLGLLIVVLLVVTVVIMQGT